jgi:phospholipid/cholesterol/gamma-HCH transport system substrate-binding protein
MDERVIQFRVGVVVIAAAIVTAILVVVFSDGVPFFSGKYTIYIRFPQAPGIQPNTPVRKSGVRIGRVSEVKLLDQGGVLVSADIDSGRNIHKDELCFINTASLLGDSVVEFISPDPVPVSTDPDDYLKDGQVIDGRVSTNPTQALDVLVRLEGDIQGALTAVQDAADGMAQLSQTLNAAVGDNGEQAQRIMAKTEGALDSFQTTMSSINEITGDVETREQLKRTLRDLPLVFDDTRQTLARAQQSLDGIDTMTAQAQQNLENLEGFTRPLGERGPQLAERFDETLRNADELLLQLVEFSRGLNEREGSIGKLVYDDELYERLNRAAANVEDLTRRLGPILDDARVFSDKIARDPSQLGVRGALNRQPGGVKFGTGFDQLPHERAHDHFTGR